MYSIYNTVSDIILDIDLPVGDSKRVNCPNCGGIKTFTITNSEGKLLWNCYKASCNVKGATRVPMSVDDISSILDGRSTKQDETFSLPEYVVPRTYDIAEWAWELYKIDAEELGLMYDVKEDRVVFPIKHDGKIIDATGRAMKNIQPKWKRYGNSGLPYVCGHGKVAVVVEDCVSAAVVGFGSPSFVGVALLGTSLQETHKGYLSQFSTAIIALDPDALTKSIEFSKELRGHVNDVRVLRLEDDLKYRNPTDMENLHGIITD